MKRFLADRSGQFSVFMAVASTMIIGALGFAIDLRSSSSFQRNLQDILDSAVLAGKADESASPTMSINIAKAYFEGQYAFNYGLDAPAVATRFWNQGDELHGEATSAYETDFAGIFGYSEVDVGVVSAATDAVARGPLCFMAMHDSRKHTLELKGTVSFIAPDCHIYGNSSHVNDVVDPHNRENFLTGKTVQAIGYGHHYLENVTPPLAYAPELIPDPLRSMPIPNGAGCTNSNPGAGAHQTFNPGTFCNGLKITGGADITFNPGTYVIQGGDFEVQNSILRGNGVTLVLKHGNEISWDNSEIRLEAPRTGQYAGIVIMGDRVGASHVIDATTVDVHGTIYLPEGVFVWINDGVPVTNAIWTAWVIDGVTWTGNGTINMEFRPEDSPIPYPTAMQNVIPAERSVRLIR